jgi:serine/threonine-protein kinase
VLQALIYAHRLGVVHRDIKPSNIMIAQNDVVKLLDFGIALTDHSAELTQTGYMLGSLNYMSPEQVSGSKATAQSDLYSVGVTLYELLTGTLPITGKTNYEIMVGHMQRVPIPPHQVAPQVPIAISDAVMRALAKDPAHRFATAEEFLHALHQSPSAREQTVGVTLPLPNPIAHASQRSAGSPPQKIPSAGSIQSLPLEEVSKKLAVYIGPVAKFVVKKLAAQSDDVDYIYRQAAKQIGSDTDRAAFLRSRSK